MGRYVELVGTSSRQRLDEMNIFKKFKCEICNAKFRQQEYLMLHKQLHHSDKMYDCKDCNKFFLSMEEMRTHMQRVHSYTGTRDI